jgi:hypothetical protein
MSGKYDMKPGESAKDYIARVRAMREAGSAATEAALRATDARAASEIAALKQEREQRRTENQEKMRAIARGEIPAATPSAPERGSREEALEAIKRFREKAGKALGNMERLVQEGERENRERAAEVSGMVSALARGSREMVRATDEFSRELSAEEKLLQEQETRWAAEDQKLGRR